MHVGFTKAYSDLDNFAHKFYVDNGQSFSEYSSENGYDNSYKAMQEYIYKAYDKAINKGMYNAEGYKYFYKTMNGTDAFPTCDDKGLFVGPGGRFYGMNNPPNENENGPVVCVDTNGAKGPNKYGYDYFLFAFTLDGRAIPMGMDYPNNSKELSMGYNFFHKGANYCNKNSSSMYAGGNTTCAYYALMDKHPTQEGKTYWKDFI